MPSTLAFAPTPDDLAEDFFGAPIVRFEAPRPAEEAGGAIVLDSPPGAHQTGAQDSERAPTP